ncbi:hypothetical protein [Natroniella sp. ANB-PHB2]|uniref:hypothetical protein n=1 Tax=Natroniella sp. ANB-PHB2 TaxID=3384444 RepID=UPI0038D375B8
MFKKIEIKTALDFGWNVLKNNYIYFIGLLIAYWFLIGLQMVSYEQLISRLLWGESVGGYSFLLLLALLLQFAIFVMIIKVGLYYLEKDDTNSVTFDQDIKISKLFVSSKSFLKISLHYVVASILFYLIVFQGLLLLVVPGIYFAIKFIFYMFYVIDKEESAIKALEESYYATAKKEISILFTIFLLSSLVMSCFLAYFILILIFSEGLAVILFIIALSIVIPLNLLALSYIYKNNLSVEAGNN